MCIRDSAIGHVVDDRDRVAALIPLWGATAAFADRYLERAARYVDLTRDNADVKALCTLELGGHANPARACRCEIDELQIGHSAPAKSSPADRDPAERSA